ncbi:MAG: metallophosphoesterase family protein [Pirellulales bacterium]
MPEGASFRFIQSGDFHLDQPLGGLPNVPDHLRDLFCEAARSATKNVFENAVLHNVDFVLLTGNLLDVRRSTPKTIGFLLQQFETLNKAGIQVYCAGGSIDPPVRWPSSIALPENVHVFKTGSPEEISFERDEQPICTISGRCNPGREPREGEYRADPTGLFTIAMSHGEIEAGTLRTSEINYWAIGGNSSRNKPMSSPVFSLFAGSPQGFSPTDIGQRSCTLVEVQEDGSLDSEALVTDVVRWQSELIELESCESISDLEQVLKNRMQTLIGSKGRRHLLVDWRVIIAGDSPKELLDETTWSKLTDVLNREFGEDGGEAWTHEVTVETSSVIPESWYQEQTISGDFLRMARELQADPSIEIDLKSMLGNIDQSGRVAQAVEIDTRETRRKVLQESRRMGVQLLRAE